MKHNIEDLDRKRMRLLEGQLLGLVTFIILSFVRFIERATIPNPPPLGGPVLIGMILSALLCATCVAAYAVLAAQIRSDPDLVTALDNELVRVYFSQSWLAAFIATAVTTLIFAAITPFAPVLSDPLMIAFTSIIVGVTAHQAAFYCKVRFS